MTTGTGTAFTSATGFERGPGLTFNSGVTFNSRGWTIGATAGADDYLQFTATIGSSAVNLSSLEIRYDRSGSGPSEIVIEANGVQIFSDSGVSQTGEENTIDLTGVPSLQNLQNTTVVFQLFGFSASSGSGTFDIEDIVGGDTDVGAVLTAALVVPVELQSFVAEAVDQQAYLRFTTATEQNSSHFLIQRSGDGRAFSTIGKVDSKGDSQREVDYLFIDEYPLPGISYYRLHQFDFDGTNEYFGPVAVRFEGKDMYEPQIWPVPAQDVLQIDFLDSDQEWTVQLYNVAGQLLLERLITDKSTRTTLDVQQLPAGTYILRSVSRSQQYSQKFIKK